MTSVTKHKKLQRFKQTKMGVSKSIKSINRLALTKQYIIALLAGFSLPLAFAPIHLIPVAFLSPLILFVLWFDKTPKIAFKLGFVFGFGFFVFGLSWVYVAIHVYGATPAWLAVIMTALFASYLALFIAIQGWLAAKLTLKYKINTGLQTLVLLPALWLLFEWIRGWFLTGMPWLHLGYAQSFPPLSGYAAIFGVYGVSFISLIITALILFSLQTEKTSSRNKAIISILLVVAMGGGLSMIEWTEKKVKTFSVSLVQGNAEQITKWDADKIRLRMDIYANLSRKHWDSDVVLWPENAMTIFYHEIYDDYLLPLAKEAKASNTDLIVGLPYLEQGTKRYYSSMVSFAAADSPMNGYTGIFHKVHLVPFGEYVPLANLIRGLVGFFDLPMSGFSQGPETQDLLTMRGEPLATSICYEDSFGEELIRQLPEATLLMNGSNNAWYGDSLAPHQHLQIAQMRAIETGRMLIRATTNGITAFIDYRGRIVARAPQFEPAVLTHTAQPRTGATPYVRWGNWPVIGFAFFLLLSVIIYANKAKNN